MKTRPTPPTRRPDWHYDKYFVEQLAKQKQAQKTTQ